MTDREGEHPGARRAVAVVTYVLTAVLTVVVIGVGAWLAASAVRGVWAYALARIAEGA